MSKLIVNEIEKYDAGQLTITTGTNVSIGSNLTVGGTIAGTLNTAAQPNITSVGTLSSLAVSGNLAVDTNTLYVDSVNNRVGIGTSSPSADSLISLLKSNVSGSNEFLRLITGSTTNGSMTLGVFPSPGNSYSFLGSNANYTSGGLARIDTNQGGSLLGLNKDSIIAYVSSGVADPTETARIDSDGLKFNGDTAAANALDDYEEGTWTPTITFGGNSVGVVYGIQQGTYTKVGNKVSVTAYLAIPNIGSSTGTSEIGGLPFSIADADRFWTGFSAGYINAFNFSGTFLLLGTRNSSVIRPGQSTGNFANLTQANFSAGASIIFTGTYFTS